MLSLRQNICLVRVESARCRQIVKRLFGHFPSGIALSSQPSFNGFIERFSGTDSRRAPPLQEVWEAGASV